MQPTLWTAALGGHGPLNEGAATREVVKDKVATLAPQQQSAPAPATASDRDEILQNSTSSADQEPARQCTSRAVAI